MAWSVKGMGDSHCSLINCKKDISLNTFFCYGITQGHISACIS